jgi:Flp pilus assembly protein TadG
MRRPRQERSKQLGFIMLVTATSLFVLVGMLGLAADLGRVYIVKNEAQAFVDMASLAAARKLNGKSSGITAAKNEVTNSTNKFNFGTQGFGTANAQGSITTVEFATKTPTSTTCPSAGPWLQSPSGNVSDYGCVRVTVNPVVNLSFLPAVGASYTQTVTARAIAGIVPQVFPAGGYMPYTPFAHNPGDPNFGFTLGEEYGFRWPGNINNKNNACHGDQDSWPTYNFSDQVGGSTRGYFELQSASSIYDAILGEKQMSPLNIGDVLNMTNGNKQTEANALTRRAGYDTDQTNYSAPSSTNPPSAPNYTGNGMRKVVMPVNSGPTGTPPYSVLGFASFLLYPSYSSGGGNKSWCAIYMGTSTQGGEGGVFNVAGAYVVRLVQ